MVKKEIDVQNKVQNSKPVNIFVILPQNFNRVYPGILLVILCASCSVSTQVANQAKRDLLNDTALLSAHVGISVFDPGTNRYWYNYQAEKYYVPASNTKLFSLYAGLKYLGDSLPAIKYMYSNDTLFLLPTGDPTFLHPDFKSQRVFDFLKSIRKPVAVITTNWGEKALGSGWSWDDYNENYMPERSALPVYGNVIKWLQQEGEIRINGEPGMAILSHPPISWKSNFKNDTTGNIFFVKRDLAENSFNIYYGKARKAEQQVPFITYGIKSALVLLKDTLRVNFSEAKPMLSTKFTTLYSQPSDSLYKIMMHRSDNFFAEQILIMVSGERLGYMNDEKIIDTILGNQLKDLPQMPIWVDGSGLSRYNLFSPKDFIYILNQMKNDFGFKRMKNILPTGSTGTLGPYYLRDIGFIFAKTGSLKNVGAISGYLVTKKNKLLIFSILANNFLSPPASVRKAFEKFLTGLRQRF